MHHVCTRNALPLPIHLNILCPDFQGLGLSVTCPPALGASDGFLSSLIQWSFVHKLGPYTEDRTRLKKEADHSRLVGGRFNKQWNLLMRPVLGNHKRSKYPHPPTRILKVCIEALTGFSRTQSRCSQQHLTHSNFSVSHDSYFIYFLKGKDLT